MRRFLISLLTFCCAANAWAAAPSVSDPWIRLVPGQSMGAGYVTLHNPNDSADQLTSISGECCTAIELHRMLDEGDHMSMHEVKAVDIPAKGDVDFQSLGYHVMFIGFKVAPPNGSHVATVLHFASGATLPVDFTVKLVGSK